MSNRVSPLCASASISLCSAVAAPDTVSSTTWILVTGSSYLFHQSTSSAYMPLSSGRTGALPGLTLVSAPDRIVTMVVPAAAPAAPREPAPGATVPGATGPGAAHPAARHAAATAPSAAPRRRLLLR